jgi:hypothetical protein
MFREMWPVERFGLHEWKIRLLVHDGQHQLAARIRYKIEATKTQETPQGFLLASPALS